MQTNLIFRKGMFLCSACIQSVGPCKAVYTSPSIVGYSFKQLSELGRRGHTGENENAQSSKR